MSCQSNQALAKGLIEARHASAADFSFGQRLTERLVRRKS